MQISPSSHPIMSTFLSKKNVTLLHLLPLLLLLHCTTAALAQPLAADPPPTGPTNITKILEKAGQFNTLIHLLAATKADVQINTQLKHSDQGFTVFAPTDNAFSALRPGTLNSLSDQEKVELVQFHVVPHFLSTSHFDTVSNPVTTQAGDNVKFPLNITTAGNQVNITTGVMETTVSNSIYADGYLALYQVDKVLLPLSLFGPPTPAAAPAPEPEKIKKKKNGTVEDSPAPAGGGGVRAEVSGTVIDRYYLRGLVVGPIVIAGLWL